MKIRYFIPGILWLAAMGLLYSTPITEPQHVFFDRIPSRSLVHGMLFLGFVHIWTAACKKQAKNYMIRRNAIPLVFGVAVGIAIIAEILAFSVGVFPSFNYWNLLFDVLGAGLGILTFKLLYQHCY